MIVVNFFGGEIMKGLEILYEMDNEELGVLVEIIKEKGGFTNDLTTCSAYQKYYPDHKKYVDKIESEIIAFGSNTFWENKSYKEILCDVCDKMKVNYNSSRDLEHIEHNLLEKVLENAWDDMSEDERKKVLNSISNGNKGNFKGVGAALLVKLFRAGGFASYQLTVVIANTIAKFVLGRGLTLAANATLTRAMSILTGPIGMAITALWTIFDIAGPAYRVTIPAVIFIASTRYIHQNKNLADMHF